MASHRNSSNQRQRNVLMTTSVFPRWKGDATPPFVLNQAEAVAEAGWGVTVLAPHAPGALFREQWGAVEIIRFPYIWPHGWQGLFYDGGMLVQLRKHPHRKWQLLFLLIAQIRATRRLCRTKSFDILHAHSLLPQGFTALYNGAVPVVATSHGNDVFGLKEGGLYGGLKRRVVQRAIALTANSSATEAALCQLGARSERIFRVPASPNVCRPSDGGVRALRAHYGTTKLLLFTGRLIEEKGVGDLISAFKLLNRSDTKLVIMGEGVDRAKFERQVMELKLNGRVDFVGWQSKETMADYLATVDVFVGPSKPGPGGWVEAQGLVFAEAMAAGTPVVATRCGGIPDMIIHENTGLLVNPGDVPALTEAIGRILDAPKLGATLSEQALKRYQQNFSPQVTTEQLLNAYEAVVST